MRFVFKTNYDQDIRLFRHGGQVFWYGLLALALLIAPSLLPEYYLSQLTFICIYSIVGVGLMLLTGYTGQVSLGHAAFLAIGAYTEAVLVANGVPFVWSIVAAVALAGLAGIAIGLPALRLSGIYLAIATMAFGFIVVEVLTRWESVTRGSLGMTVRSIDLAGIRIDQEWKLYYVALAAVVLGDARRAQPPAVSDRTRIHRDSRLRDFGAEHGHSSRTLQDYRVRVVSCHHRARRRAVRAQASVHQSGAVRNRCFDRARDDDLYRRHRLVCTAQFSARSS